MRCRRSTLHSSAYQPIDRLGDRDAFALGQCQGHGINILVQSHSDSHLCIIAPLVTWSNMEPLNAFLGTDGSRAVSFFLQNPIDTSSLTGQKWKHSHFE